MENEIPNQTPNQLLIQHINEAALFTDSSFVVTTCNKGAADLFHCTPQDLLGFHISSLVSITSLTNNQVLTIKNPAFIQGIEYVTRAGKIQPVQFTRHAIAPHATDGGYLFIYKPVVQDHSLLKSGEHLHCPYEQPGEAIIIFNKTYHCLDANIHACRLTGYTRQELTNLSLQDLLHYDELHQAMFDTTIWNSSEKVQLEKKMKAKDGSTWYAELIFQQLSDDRIFSFVRDITKQKTTELALMESTRESRKSTAQLRELSDHLLNIRETERKNIAREIHDELGQLLTILKMDVSWLHQKLQKYKDATVLQKTADTLQLLNETIKTVRRIATELRPSMLDDLGLTEAIEWQSKEFEKRSGIKITFKSGIAHLPVANSIATSLFRIYQEALTNIARHAKAKNVFSDMQLENGQVILTIKDDGVGFDMQTLGVKKTLGLLGMQERTLMMGGRFEIISKAGEGTTIKITTSLQSDDTAKS